MLSRLLWCLSSYLLEHAINWPASEECGRVVYQRGAAWYASLAVARAATRLSRFSWRGAGMGALLLGALLLLPARAQAAPTAPAYFYEFGDVAYDPASAGNYTVNGAVFQYAGVLTIRDNDTSKDVTVCRFDAYNASVPRVCRQAHGNGAWLVSPTYTYTISGIARGWLHYYAGPVYGVPIIHWYMVAVPLILR